MTFEPRNPIEEYQAEALLEKGIDPEEWTFERQRRNWPYEWSSEVLSEIRRNYQEGPSRLELIEAVGTYRVVADGIRRAATAEGNEVRRFAIATDPKGPTRHDTFWWQDLEDPPEPFDHVLWINLGFWNMLKIITHQVTWALARPAGGTLMKLSEALGQFDDPTELALRLYRNRRPIVTGSANPTRWRHNTIWYGSSYPPYGQFPPERADLNEANAVLLASALAWTVGHEYGHALAHAARANERGVQAEQAADRWGITAVWKGLEIFADPIQGFRMSWQGATAALGAVAASLMTEAPSPDATQVEDAYHRLTGFITALLEETARHWEICEVKAIGKCAAVLAAAIVQWLLWEWEVEDAHDAGMGRLLKDGLIDRGAEVIQSLPNKIPCTGQHGPTGQHIVVR